LADNFIMIEGESAEEMYRRLVALSVQMCDHGATFMDDNWIKRKFYNSILPYEVVKLTAIRQNANFHSMTSNEVLSEIIALDISKKNADALVVRAHNAHKPNLALKVNEHEESESYEDPVEWSSDDFQSNYHEHMALAAKNFWDGNKTRSSRPRGNSRFSPRDSPRAQKKGKRQELSTIAVPGVTSLWSDPLKEEKKMVCFGDGRGRILVQESTGMSPDRRAI
jgi:hypothetical protein